MGIVFLIGGALLLDLTEADILGPEPNGLGLTKRESRLVMTIVTKVQGFSTSGEAS